MLRRWLAGSTIALGATLCLGAGGAAAKPILMPGLSKALAAQHTIALSDLAAATTTSPLQPPAPPCPENGLLPAPLGACGLPELPATGVPLLGDMAYYGGHVQTVPKVYLVYWGWGEPGAFPATAPCRSESLSEGPYTATLACDPDGAGRQMADFVQQLGGTPWAGVQTQYYQTDSAGNQQFVTNPSEQLAGIWTDDATDASGLPKTTATNPAGPTNTYTDLAQEAARAVTHFGITDLANADIVILQPQNFSDPNAQSQGYCAFHDYTEPGLEQNIYAGITPGISYTNEPYVLNQGVGCGENFVNSGTAGKLDGFTVSLGHELEETVTDPGAEDIVGGTQIGGWYDALDADENGDKCAYVGTTPLSGVAGLPAVVPIPGALHDMTGNAGGTFAVQSLWSNQAESGIGYCDG